MSDLPGLLQLLQKQGVEFIVVGGIAATAHGSTRLTSDIDIVYRRTPENILRLAQALGSVEPYLRGAPPGLPFKWDAETIEKGLNFTLTTSLGPIDALGEIAGGGGYDQLAKESSEMRIFGLPCLCIELDALIRVKRIAGRRKDLDAVAELELIRNEMQKRGSN